MDLSNDKYITAIKTPSVQILLRARSKFGRKEVALVPSRTLGLIGNFHGQPRVNADEIYSTPVVHWQSHII